MRFGPIAGGRLGRRGSSSRQHKTGRAVFMYSTPSELKNYISLSKKNLGNKRVSLDKLKTARFTVGPVFGCCNLSLSPETNTNKICDCKKISAAVSSHSGPVRFVVETFISTTSHSRVSGRNTVTDFSKPFILICSEWLWVGPIQWIPRKSTLYMSNCRIPRTKSQ